MNNVRIIYQKIFVRSAQSSSTLYNFKEGKEKMFIYFKEFHVKEESSSS